MSLAFGKIKIETSNRDALMFPDDGITKGDLIDYYVSVADAMLPHLRERPLSFQRFTGGIAKPGFFQKDTPEHYPDWISTLPVDKKGGQNCQVVADRPATLAYLANNRVVTIHGALASGSDLHKPDRFIFDLDPSVDDFSLVKRAAEVVREILEDLGLACFIQTTGSRGLHVVAPIKPEYDFEAIGAAARRVAELVVESDPDAFTIERLKADRGDRLLIDYFRNSYAQTSVAAYSVRAKPGAPVATPIEWDELHSLPREAQSYDIRSIPRRLNDKSDPWKGMTRKSRSMKKVLDRLM